MAREQVSDLEARLESALQSSYRIERELGAGGIQTRFNEAAPMVSPNGHLLAYVSDESGRNEVYVRSTGGDERRWLVTTDGGGEPLWRRDGKEIFFRRGADVFAVPVDGGDVPRFGTAVRLFSGSYVGGSRWTGYDVAPDGKRFLMVRNERADERIDVITDWTSLLRSVPADRTP